MGREQLLAMTVGNNGKIIDCKCKQGACTKTRHGIDSLLYEGGAIMSNPEKTVAAQKSDWNTSEMPAQHTTFTIERKISPSEMEKLKFGNIPHEYYGAAEPPVRRGGSHLSGLTEPPCQTLTLPA